jgi:hypothetical protein
VEVSIKQNEMIRMKVFHQDQPPPNPGETIAATTGRARPSRVAESPCTLSCYLSCSFPALPRRILFIQINILPNQMFYQKREVMRKNFLQVASAVALSLTVAFAGCTREEGNASSETRSVFLKVASAETRAMVAPVPTLTETTLGDGWLFFTNGSGVISKILEIGTTNDYDPGTADDVVGTTELEDGIQIEDVPGTATRVYVFSNVHGTAWQPSDGDNVSTYEAKAVTVLSQYTAAGDVSVVTLYGSGNIIDDPDISAADDEFIADVEVAPVAGRIEIDKITARAEEVTTFNVTGVFINYYYHTTTINGTFVAGDFVNNGPTVANYAPVGSGGTYPLPVGALYDVTTVNSSTGSLLPAPVAPVVEQTLDNVWAYNVLAPARTGYFPHIVIKINITAVANVAYAAFVGQDYYLTITNVVAAGTVNPDADDYLDFTKGKIYTIDNISFSLGDLSTTPEPAEKKVTVTVTVLPWVTTPVDPVL